METRLYAAQEKADFLDALAAGTPTPGGGSAAAYAAAMGAGLVAMVAQLSMGKKKYAEVEDAMQGILAEAEALRARLTKAVDEDAASFEAIMQAFKFPKETDAEKAARSQKIQEATLTAAQIPLQTAKDAVRVMELALEAARMGNTNAITDGASGAAMARAALTSAGYNVRDQPGFAAGYGESRCASDGVEGFGSQGSGDGCGVETGSGGARRVGVVMHSFGGSPVATAAISLVQAGDDFHSSGLAYARNDRF